MLGQRVAGEIEAEDLLFLDSLLALVPTRARRAGSAAAGVRLFVLVAAEEAHLAAAAVGGGGRAGLHRPIDGGEQLRPAGAERVEGPGLDQRFDGRAVDRARIEPLAEVEQAAVGAVLARARRRWPRRPRRRSP